MFKKTNVTNIISAGILLFISWFYLFKYSSIYFGHPLILSTLFTILIGGIIVLFDKINWNSKRVFNRKSLSIFSALIILGVVLYVTFIPRFGSVGRLPAINDWLEKLFRHQFPYGTPITPSGFPFLYFFALPFYLIKNVGYFEVGGIILFTLFLFYFSKSNKEIIIRSLWLYITPILIYEIVVRGELFTNSILILVILFVTEKKLNPDKIDFNFLLISVLFGLVLSTRSVLGLAYIVYMLYYFRFDFKNGLVSILISSTTFLVILIPFLIWDTSAFFNYGPFAIQSYLSHIPIWVILFIFILALYAGWVVSDIYEVFFAVGILFFLPVLISMIFAIAEVGFYKAIVGDVFDLSYYIFCLPFLIMAMHEYKVDKFLGKVFLDE